MSYLQQKNIICTSYITRTDGNEFKIGHVF